MENRYVVNEGHSKYDGLTMLATDGVHDSVVEEIQKKVKAGSKILDIGAGVGAMSKRLHDLGYEVVAVDICEENFKPKDIRFVKFDIEQKLHNIINEKFDCIIAIEVIEHLYNPSEIYETAKQLSKKETCFMITTPNIASFVSVHSLFRHSTLSHFHHRDLWVETGHVSPISIYQLQNLAIDNGFYTEEIKAIGNLSIFNFRNGYMKGILLGFIFIVLNLVANKYFKGDNILWIGIKK